LIRDLDDSEENFEYVFSSESIESVMLEFGYNRSELKIDIININGELREV
jgi:hypothetical protein